MKFMMSNEKREVQISTWIKLFHEFQIFKDSVEKESILLLQKVEIFFGGLVKCETDHLKEKTILNL